MRCLHLDPWITVEALQEQAERVTPPAFAQFHACRWGAGEGAWLPPGAWTACRDDYAVEDGTAVCVGVDIGGSRAASAVVAITDDLRVTAVEIIQGNASVLEATAAIVRMGRHVHGARGRLRPVALPLRGAAPGGRARRPRR